MTTQQIINGLKGYRGIIMYPTEEAEALKEAAIKALEKHNKPYERYMPCICGYNKRQTWYCNGEHGAYIRVVCKKCGFSIDGKNESDAKRNWNTYMADDRNKPRGGCNV